MATDVILPALGIAQETGKILQWLKAEGQEVTRGEPVAEIETDKATVELEAPATGFLANISAAAGQEIPVGQVIASILTPAEWSQRGEGAGDSKEAITQPPAQAATLSPRDDRRQQGRMPGMAASPLAARIAAEHNLDLSQVKTAGRRIQKADVLTYLQQQGATAPTAVQPRLQAASPKARRLARLQGKDVAAIKGTGPEGAVLAADVLAAPVLTAPTTVATASMEEVIAPGGEQKEAAISTIWRIMAERTTQSWTSVPHFFLVREVNASRFIAWREHIQRRSAGEAKVTYSDLLVRVVAAVLRKHPRLNAAWHEGSITWNKQVNIGLAVAVEEGLVVPVIHQADRLSVREIADKRQELVAKAQSGKLRPDDLAGGTFTISNLGMYGVDAFNAIVNQPQAAILAVGRITDRVVPLNGQPTVQPVMTLSLSCDHRVVDGARGAQFLSSLAEMIEDPLGLLD